MKDKGIPFPNLGANILLEAPTLGANNLFHELINDEGKVPKNNLHFLPKY